MIPAVKLQWNREFTKTDAPITNARTISVINTRAAIGFISPIKQARPMRANQLRKLSELDAIPFCFSPHDEASRITSAATASRRNAIAGPNE